jgi:hypothetical protein
MMESEPRTIRMRVKPPNPPLTANGQASTRRVLNRLCFGHELMEAEPEEALGMIADGVTYLDEGQELTEQDRKFFAYRSDPLGPSKAGRYRGYSEFA